MHHASYKLAYNNKLRIIPVRIFNFDETDSENFKFGYIAFFVVSDFSLASFSGE